MLSERLQNEVLEEIADRVPPAVLNQLRAHFLQPALDHVYYVPKASVTVMLFDDTYFFPVFKPSGFKFTALKKPKMYSIGALAKE